MAYIVKRPINLNGKRRSIGEIIQDDEILNRSIIRTGWVKKIKEPEAMNPPEYVPQEETPVIPEQPRKKSRRKAKTEDGGDA